MKSRIAIAGYSILAILSASTVAQTLIWVKLQTLTGRVVRFDPSGKQGSGDLIVRIANQKRFVRLIYCPSNCGIDVPQPSEPLPGEITNKSDLVWTFGVHEPESQWERMTCGSNPKILERGARPGEVVFRAGNALCANAWSDPSSGSEGGDASLLRDR